MNKKIIPFVILALILMFGVLEGCAPKPPKVLKKFYTNVTPGYVCMEPLCQGYGPILSDYANGLRPFLDILPEAEIGKTRSCGAEHKFILNKYGSEISICKKFIEIDTYDCSISIMDPMDDCIRSPSKYIPKAPKTYPSSTSTNVTK